MSEGAPQLQQETVEQKRVRVIHELINEYQKLETEIRGIASRDLMSGQSHIEEITERQTRRDQIEKDLAKLDVFIGEDSQAA